MMTEIFIPARITNMQSIDLGEIREISLTLPKEYEIDGTTYPVQDEMRPGTAFLAKPFGARTQKKRRRMYTRSNCAQVHPGILETIINHTHEEKADTSIWWQSEQVGIDNRIEVRVDLDEDRRELILFENTKKCERSNLRLEPDHEWPTMRFLGIAFSTGITPFLAHLCYMKTLDFGRTEKQKGAHYTLIVSVRSPRQLMEHEQLLELERTFPKNFRYHPVLTREWPNDWQYTKGRIIRSLGSNNGEETIDLGPLLEVVPDLSGFHVRMCGGKATRNQLEHGLHQSSTTPLSIRTEVW
jgi:hypothetical protein